MWGSRGMGYQTDESAGSDVSGKRQANVHGQEIQYSHHRHTQWRQKWQTGLK